jgi:hypothetical protein
MLFLAAFSANAMEENREIAKKLNYLTNRVNDIDELEKDFQRIESIEKIVGKISNKLKKDIKRTCTKEERSKQKKEINLMKKLHQNSSNNNKILTSEERKTYIDILEEKTLGLQKAHNDFQEKLFLGKEKRKQTHNNNNKMKQHQIQTRARAKLSKLPSPKL